MGEFLSTGAVQKALKNSPSIAVNGYRLTKNLARSLSNVGIQITEQNDVEHDTLACFTKQGKLVVVFGQVKTLFRYCFCQTSLPGQNLKTLHSLQNTPHSSHLIFCHLLVLFELEFAM